VNRARALVVVTALAAPALGCGPEPRPPASAPPSDPLRGVSGAELFQRGLAMAEGGDYVRAEQYMTSAIHRGHPEEKVLPALLRVCLASSRLRAALAHAEPYLERHPDAWSLRYLVATIYLGVGDVERARAALERVIADAPGQPDAYYLLGVVLRDEVGDRPMAARRFVRYLELAPTGAHADEVRGALRALQAFPGTPPGPEAATPATTPAPTPTTSPTKVPP
jgi:tetratricopeptide (TPR) repeat protein